VRSPCRGEGAGGFWDPLERREANKEPHAVQYSLQLGIRVTGMFTVNFHAVSYPPVIPSMTTEQNNEETVTSYQQLADTNHRNILLHRRLRKVKE